MPFAWAARYFTSFCFSLYCHACRIFSHPNSDAPDSSFSSRRPLFRDASGTLDKSARFSALYRQDSNKLSNDDMLKLLADFRKLVATLQVLCVNRLTDLPDVLEHGNYAPIGCPLDILPENKQFLLPSVNLCVHTSLGFGVW